MNGDPIDRRNLSQRLVQAGAAAGALAAGSGIRLPRARASATAELSVNVLLKEPIGTIRPAV